MTPYARLAAYVVAAIALELASRLIGRPRRARPRWPSRWADRPSCSCLRPESDSADCSVASESPCDCECHDDIVDLMRSNAMRSML